LLCSGLVAIALVGAWPRRKDDALARAAAAYSGGRWNEAISQANAWMKRKPGDPEALRLLARASARLGRAEMAKALYGRLGTAAMGAEDYYLVATGLARLNQRPEVVQSALEMALRIDPRNPEALEEAAQFHAQRDELEESAKFAQRLAAVPGWEARGDVRLGMVLHALSDATGAAAGFERALKRDPMLKGAAITPAEARKRLAVCQLELERPDAAEATLTALRDSRDSEIDWLLSRAFLQQGSLGKTNSVVSGASAYRKEHPLQFEPSPYVGSERCAGCHPANYRAQLRSRHAKTFHRPGEMALLELPAKPIADPSDNTVVHTINRESPTQLRATAVIDGKTTFAIADYLLGSGDRGLTLVGTDGTGQAREFRLSRYNDGSGWDRTTGQPRGPSNRADYLGTPQTAKAVRLCLGCHTTNFRAARDREGPAAADHAIGCERCHGPGGNHLKAADAEWSDLAIAQPRLASGAEVVRLCGECHTPRNFNLSRSDPNALRFQAATLTWSRCYTESRAALSCVTCHNPHDDAQKSKAFYESKCLACHSSNPPKPAHDGTRTVALAAEIKRICCPIDPARDCVECHMPVVKDVVPHTPFTDHQIRVHAEKRPAPAQERGPERPSQSSFRMTTAVP
jgi:tetratricopeptide (TPR) repeat protein